MFETVIQGIFSAAFLASILRVTTPILLPSLGALVSDRAGVINIGLEGIMLSSAFTGVVFSAYAQRWFGVDTGRLVGPWLGLAMGLAVAMTLALLLGFFHLRLKADLILSGIALNILGSAGTVAIMFELTGDRGNTSTLASLTMPFIRLPQFINDIPLIGPFIFQVFDNQNLMTWIAFLSVIAVWFLLYRTPFGMHLRAVGENFAAAESVGIPVQRTRYIALILSGLFAGLGGIHMSMGYLSHFQRDMTNNRGFIALATPLLGNNNPVGTGAASLIFGLFAALENQIGSLKIPSHLTMMIPYVATVMSLVIYALQRRQTERVRALRAAEGEGFNISYWRIVQYLSLLHMLMAMIAVIGVIISISLFAAPKGFGGDEIAHPLGVLFAVVSAALIAGNLPFITHLERIPRNAIFSGAVTTLSLGVYLGLFLALFWPFWGALVGGIALGLAAWAALGGVQLARMVQPAPRAAH